VKAIRENWQFPEEYLREIKEEERKVEREKTDFLKDMNNFSRINKVYGEYFTGQFPARSCIEVSRLPKEAEIEIEVIAFCI